MNSNLASAQEAPTNTNTGADYVAWTLDQLSAMFGHLFAKDNQIQLSNGQTALGDRSGLWSAELKNLKPEWLMFGLNRYRDRIRAESKGGDKVWPPTAVQFAAACIPTAEDLGYASAEEAWQQACRQSHQPKSIKCPAVQAAANGLWFEIRNASSDWAIAAVKKRFAGAYAAVINRVLAGEGITQRSQLEHKVPAARAVIDTLELTQEQKQYAAELRNRMLGKRQHGVVV